MKIAILTSGVLPVPAVNGGAVENLLDFCLEHNDKYHLHDIMVFSVYHPNIKGHPALNSKVNRYYYISTSTWWGRIRKYIFKHRYSNKGYYHYSVEYYLSEAIKIIRCQKYDIILIENRPGYILRLNEIISSKIVIHQENDYINAHTKFGEEIYNKTTLIINTSDYITQKVKTINRDDNKCITVLNGIDTAKFYNALSFNRQLLHFQEEDCIIVYNGRLTEDKGILQLIQSIKRIEIPNLKLLIIGASAYGKDKQPTSFIRQLEDESKPIKSKVVFTGYINYDQVPSYLKMADIAVVPSLWEEPFGLTVVEAMAAGLPLITTRSGGIPEICEGVATIVERDNIIDNLAAAILDLYHNPVKRKQMSAASLERSKMFDKESYAKNFFAALESI